MTAPLEIEEPEPVPLSGLLRTRCRICRTAEALAAPDQVGNAMCGPCRLAEASAATTIQRLPAETPPVGVLGGSEINYPQSGSQGALVPCPVCATSKIEKLCTYTGHVPPVPPKLVCPPGCPHPMPGPVQDLQALALRLDWKTSVVHSRGKPAGARTVSDLWSVRFRRLRWAGYAVRIGDTWKNVAVSGDTLTPLVSVLGVTELREWLKQPEQDQEWYSKIKKRRADAALAGKTRACPGPGECVWVDEKRGDHTHRANGDIKIKNSKKEKVGGL
jgi:hypothetical protein